MALKSTTHNPFNLKSYNLLILLLFIALFSVLVPVTLFAQATPATKVVDPNANSKIKLIYPVNNMIIYEQRDWVTGVTAGAKAENVNIRIIEKASGNEVENVDVEVEYNTSFIAPVEYAPGINTIKVDDYTINIFYQESEAVKPPEEFTEALVHQSVPDLCQECHDTFQEGKFPLNDENVINICENCHKSRIYNRLRKAYKFIHTPVKEGKCTLCHDVHVSKNEHMLKKPQQELCSDCHKTFIDKVSKEKFIHLGQMYDRICTKCHNPHSSNIKGLMRDVRKGICTKCHEAFSGEKEGVEYKSIHKPVVEGKCQLCHEIHKGRNKMFLIKDETKDTCIACHTNKLGAGHGAKLAECTNCHNAHISDKEGLFTDKGIKTCLECHKDLKYKQDLKQKSDCQLCHNPHSNNNKKNAMESCKNCHESTKLTTQHSDVTPQYENCSKCHLLHGGGDKGLLKENTHPLKEDKGCRGCHATRDPESARTSCLECHSGQYDAKHPMTIRNAESCYNCHKVHGGGFEKMLKEFQHKPFSERKCKDCHLSVDESLLLSEKAESGELCLGCHKNIDQSKDGVTYAVQHKPFKEKQCAKCHESHTSDYPKLAKGVGTNFCYKCHKSFEHDEAGKPFFSIHQPINTGECLKCHNPHGSNNVRMLRNIGTALCFACHEDFTVKESKAKTPTAKGGMIAKAVEGAKEVKEKHSSIHKPILQTGCIDCHTPHSSNSEKLFKVKKGKLLCYNCHKDFGYDEDGEKIGFIHEPVLKGECTKCHEKHANDNPSLLNKLPNELCDSCHTLDNNHHKIMKTALEMMTPIPDSFVLDDRKTKLICTNCHSPHSSKEKYLFAKPKEKLCTLCHKGVPTIEEKK